MITEERKIKIMELIRRDGFVSVRQLMDILDISRSSVMRDLDDLENQGLVVRQRGGASLVDSNVLLSQYNELPTRDKQFENSNVKRRICKYAASCIQDGSNIYIDSGTTVLYLIDYILDKEVNIITPNTLLLNKVPENFKGSIIMLGGEFFPKSECVGGSITGMNILNYHFDCAFLTTSGIDLKTEEVSGFIIPFSANKQMVLKRSDCAYLLVDSSKVGVNGLSTWANFQEFNQIFIDKYEGENIPENVTICE